MASKEPFSVDGLTVDQILKLDADTLNKMSSREMSRALRTAALAANKRINRLLAQAKKTKEGYKLKKSAKYDIALDALNYITKDGKLDPKFSAKGKTLNQLRSELARIRTFMNDLQTSTIKGAMKVRKDREIRILGLSKEDYLKEALKEEAKFCPNCGEKLITGIAKLYDLEDNLILRPKARCSKCPFQLTD